MSVDTRTDPPDQAAETSVGPLQKENTHPAGQHSTAGFPGVVMRWLPLLAVAVIALLLAPRLADYARHSWEALTFPWQFDFDEGINANASWLLSQGTNIYRPNPPDHFISSMYPPLYFLWNALAMKLWGLNLWSGRLLALLGALGVAAMLWAWVRVETRRHAAGAISALLWLALGPVYVWSTFYKQDMPALALSLTGGVMAALWQQKTYTAGTPQLKTHNSKLKTLIYSAIIPLSLAFWMKQSSLAAMAAVGLMLLLTDWQLALRWVAWAASAILVPFLALDLLLKGGLHTHVLAFDHYGRSLPRLGKNMDALWTQHWPLVLCGAALLLWAAWVFLGHRTAPQLSALYLLATIPAALLSNTLPTANYNHLLDLLAPICLSAGVLLGHAWNHWVHDTTSRLAWSIAAAGLLLLVLAQAGLFYAKPGWTWYTPLGIPLDERAQQMEKLSQLVSQTPGDLLSEDNWLLLKNGKRVLYDDPAAMAALANAGSWDQSTFLQDLQRRKFPLVILQYDITGETFNPRWTDEALKTLKDNYAIQFRDVEFVHAPKPPPAEPEKALGCATEGTPTLKGFTYRATTANPGDQPVLSLYWTATNAQPDPNARFFVRLLDGAGTSKWGADLAPGQAAGKPLASLPAGETVRDDITVPVAPDLPEGDYTLALGSYAVDAGGNIKPLAMRCSGAEQQADDTITLTPVKVVKRWGK